MTNDLPNTEDRFLEAKVERLVGESDGSSVTPDRLLNTKQENPYHPRLSVRAYEPVIRYLRDYEQPQYILFSNRGIKRTTNISERSIGVGKYVVCVVTDWRILLLSASRLKHTLNTIELRNVSGATTSKSYIYNKMVLRIASNNQEYVIEFPKHKGWGTRMISSGIPVKQVPEIRAASEYINELVDAENASWGWGENVLNGKYESARRYLYHVLSEIPELARKCDLKYVTTMGASGARVGGRMGPYAAAAGFVIASGYGVWSDLNGAEPSAGAPDPDAGPTRSDGASDSDRDCDFESVLGTINTDELLREIKRWRQIGESVGESAELAMMVIGVAVYIDELSNGPKLPSLVSQLDLESLADTIEKGGKREVTLELADQGIEIYYETIEEMLDAGFFTQLLDELRT